MDIKIFKKPNREITQSVLYFQFRFMGWTKKDLEHQDDEYGSVPFAYVVGYENGEIVSVTNLLKRKIAFNGKKILIGGFGCVCTHDKYRRKGLASQILKAGFQELKKEKCDIAFLCTDIEKLSGVYDKIGFVPLSRNYKATGRSKKEYISGDGMIAPVCSKEVFKNVLKDKNIFDLQGQNW